MQSASRLQTQQHRRSGVYIPLLVLTLLVVIGALSVVVNRLWVNAARAEMTTAAESAALAAAGHLADDSVLSSTSSDDLIESAVELAIETAAGNRVAGVPLEIAEDDVRFGRMIVPDGESEARFIETSEHPTFVEVHAYRTRNRNNPVGMFLDELAGTGGANVVVSVRAALENHLVGFRPTADVPLKFLPMAILSHSADGRRQDTWQHAIVHRGGADEYSVDDSGRVAREPDGIPELTLTFYRSGDERAATGNAHLIDISSDFDDDQIIGQIETGVTSEMLDEFDGELTIHPGHEEYFASSPILNHDVADALQSIIGQQRLCPLFTSWEAMGPNAAGEVRSPAVIAIRVMAVHSQSDGRYAVVVQPTVMTSRLSITAQERGFANDAIEPNPYIYKLHLTK